MSERSQMSHFERIQELKKEKYSVPPYSEHDYKEAKNRYLDLDDWDDYKEYYNLGNEVL